MVRYALEGPGLLRHSPADGFDLMEISYAPMRYQKL